MAEQEGHISGHELMTTSSACWRATLIAVTLIGVLTMPPKPAVAEMPPALYKLGLPAAAGAVAVTVSSADLSADQQDGQALQLVVRYTVKNVSFDPVAVAAIPQMRLLDPNGELHDPADIVGGPILRRVLLIRARKSGDWRCSRWRRTGSISRHGGCLSGAPVAHASPCNSWTAGRTGNPEMSQSSPRVDRPHECSQHHIGGHDR